MLELLLSDAGVKRHLLRVCLKKPVVVDVPDNQLGGFAVVAVQNRLVQLPHQMLLQGFLRSDGIEKELALVIGLL